MKRCPDCRRDYTDETLIYCLDDGARLIDGPFSGSEPPTAILRSADRVMNVSLMHDLATEDRTGSFRPVLFGPSFRILVAVLILLTIAALGWMIVYRDRSGFTAEPKQFELGEAKEGMIAVDSAPALLFSPDGKRLVATLKVSGTTQLFQRLVSEPDWQPITGTEGARDPFFSPDGNTVAFFARAELKMVPLTGGATAIISAANARGGTWESNKSLIYTPGTDSPLYRVSSTGGEASAISTLDSDAKERSHRWPEMLPSHNALLFNVVYQTGNPLDNADVAILDLKTGKHKVLIKGAAFPRYSPTGHIIYATAKGLFAIPFDESKGDITGPAFELIRDVQTSAGNGRAQYSFSQNGDLVFLQRKENDKDSDTENGLLSISRNGEEKPVQAPLNRYSKPRFADAGKLIYSEIRTNQVSVYSIDIERGTLTPITQAGVSYNPAPNPNDKIIAYEAVRDGVAGVMISNSDGSDERRLTSTKQFQFPSSWSPDGKTLLITAGTDRGFTEIWSINLDAAGDPQVLVSGNFNAAAGRFSPDGKWIAYVSDESGRNEIYIRSAAGEANKLRVSIDGGIQPVWAPSGKELFFRTSREFYSAALRFTPAPGADKPIVLFSKDFAEDSSGPAYETEPDYDVSSDGNSFILGRHSFESDLPEKRLILNWFTTIIQAGKHSP